MSVPSYNSFTASSPDSLPLQGRGYQVTRVFGFGGAIALVGTLIPAVHAVASPVPTHLAQSLIGQCRQLNRLERIYSAADLAGDRISDLSAGTRVTLAGEVNQPTFGWVRVSYPVTGYVQTAFLIPCGTASAPSNSSQPPRQTPTSQGPTTPSQSCGTVIPEALTVRSGPATTFPVVLNLNRNDFLRLIGGPQIQTQPPMEQGRIWVQVERSGVTGWVAETGPQGLGNNVQRVSCSL